MKMVLILPQLVLFIFSVPKRVLKPLRRHKHRKRKKKKQEVSKEKESNSSHSIPSSSTLSFNHILPKTTKRPALAKDFFPAGMVKLLEFH